MRIGASEQVTVFLKNERRVELRGSGDHELRCWSLRMQQGRTRSHTGERLSCAAVSTEDIVGRNTSAAEAAVDRLHLHRLNACYRMCRHSIAHTSMYQLLEMIRELVSQLACCPVTIFRLVLDRSHQDQFHL